MTSGRFRGVFSVLILLAVALPAQAASINVNVATDDDIADANCSLREAIIAANTDADYHGCIGAAAYGTDAIFFSIPGAGPHIVSLTTALPNIVTPMHINGYSQSGSSPNNTSVGTNAVIQVGIANGGAVLNGLRFGSGADGSSVAGLQISGFSTGSILVEQADNVSISGNFIGTDGTSNLGGGFRNIRLALGASNVVVGGDGLGDRNLITGGSTSEIYIDNVIGGAVTINNNLIGTASDGTTPLATHIGIEVTGGSNHVIRDNVIGAGRDGIEVVNDVTGLHVTGNAIGVGSDGVASIAGAGHGIWILSWSGGAPTSNYVGGLASGEGNVIANWGGNGVRVSRMNDSNTFPHGNSILGNQIFGNGGLGIELMLSEGGDPVSEGVGVTPNDIDDVDDGANHYQNFPVITAASTDGIYTTVSFTLDIAPGSNTYRTEYFSSQSCDASGHGEGAEFLYGQNWIPIGDFDETVNSLPVTTAGHFITMTATNLTTDDTSEFSACFPIAAAPPPGILVQPTSGLVTTEAGGTASFTVNLLSAPTGDVTIGLSSSNTAEATVAPSSLTFTPLNWAVPQIVTLTGVDDAIADGNVPYSVITAAAVSEGSPSYNGLDAADVTAINIDDEIAFPGVLQFTVSAQSVNEGGATATISVSRSGGTAGSVGVSYATADGSALNGADYTATSGILSWADGDAADKSFTVSVIDDALVEAAETFTAALSAPTGGALLGSTNIHAVTVVDNDSVPSGSTLHFTVAAQTVDESAGTVTVSVRRSGSSAGAVTVAYATVAGSATAPDDFAATSGVLSWADGDFADKSFTVAITADGQSEGSELFSIVLTDNNPADSGIVGEPNVHTVTIQERTNSGPAPIPALGPLSLLLLGVALAGLAARQQRRPS